MCQSIAAITDLSANDLLDGIIQNRTIHIHPDEKWNFISSHVLYK